MRWQMAWSANVILVASAFALAGCGGRSPGSFDTDDSPSVSTRLGNLLAFNKTASPATATVAKATPLLTCPEIIVLEGTAAQRVYNGPQTNDSLRYQFSLGDVARECAHDGNQVTLKVGIEGKVLLGPAGSPGNFTVPVRIAVVREKDEQPVVSKLYRVASTVAPGQTQGSFTVISDPLVVPYTTDHSEDDYSIKVGIDTGGSADAEPRGKKRAR